MFVPQDHIVSINPVVVERRAGEILVSLEVGVSQPAGIVAVETAEVNVNRPKLFLVRPVAEIKIGLPQLVGGVLALPIRADVAAIEPELQRAHRLLDYIVGRIEAVASADLLG